jgi:uncharacterized protein (TIGR04141 family)
VPDFGLDVEQDLLRAATGIPREERYGKRLSGMDSLHVLTSVKVYELRELLGGYLDKFGDTAYRRSFPWVDHIAEVTDPTTIAALDGEVIKKLKSRDWDRCWLAIPEVIDWAEIDGFRYGFRARDPQYHDLHLEHFLGGVDAQAQLTAELLRKRYASAVDVDGLARHRWTIHQCLYCEIDYRGNSYLLTGAKWYRVSSDFVANVNSYYASIPRYMSQLPEYSDSSEQTYCQRVAIAHPDRYALMDRKLIPIGGGYNKIEFCDLYTPDRDLIHIKRYAASSVLSHLFSQGVVSGESFRMDPPFRMAVSELLPLNYKLSEPAKTPDTSAYRIVFGVVSDQPSPSLTLPFFSRVNLKHAAMRLQGYGYKVAVAKIAVARDVTTLKKYKPH